MEPVELSVPQMIFASFRIFLRISPESSDLKFISPSFCFTMYSSETSSSSLSKFSPIRTMIDEGSY